MSSTRESSTFKLITDHLKSLMQSDVPNYKTCVTNALSWYLVSGMSALSDCNSSITNLTLLMAVVNTAMAVNQTGWDHTLILAAQGADSITDKLDSALNQVKKNTWIKEKVNTVTTTVANQYDMLFVRPVSKKLPEAVAAKLVKTQEDNKEILREESNKLIK